MLFNAEDRYAKGRDIKNIMKVYIIPTHSEFDCSDSYKFGGTFSVS